MLASSSKLLGFLVNDILDYAMLKAGKFRKEFAGSNLKAAVKEIFLICQYKAMKNGVKIEIKF